MRTNYGPFNARAVWRRSTEGTGLVRLFNRLQSQTRQLAADANCLTRKSPRDDGSPTLTSPPMPAYYANDRHYHVALFGCFLTVVLLSSGICAPPAQASALRHTAVVDAVSQARPSVVNIHGRKTLPVEYESRATSESGSQVNGMGTGIVIDERGYIITNYHVVEGVSRIRVTMADESTAVAQLVANDPKTDLAIIKISCKTPLPAIHIGTSEDLMPGETVVAVGNAYGYEHTVTKGIISALHRSVQVSDYQKYHDLIQTDASINPGNSGGPLLNIDGEMIGINVAVRVGAQGIGFAIPINEAMDVAAELMSAERLSRISHGARIKTRYDSASSHAVVESVLKGSAADKAGLRVGDSVVAVGDRTVVRRLDFERALLKRQAGEEIHLEVERDGQTLQLSMVLRDGPGLRRTATDEAWEVVGIRLSPIATSTFRKYHTRYRGGMKVTSVRAESPAFQHGIRRGDILVGMHKWETISQDNIAYILNSAEFKATQPFKFYILRGADTLYGTMNAEIN